jgi:hypothetical protein
VTYYIVAKSSYRLNAILVVWSGDYHLYPISQKPENEQCLNPNVIHNSSRAKYLFTSYNGKYGIYSGFGVWIEIDTIVDSYSAAGSGISPRNQVPQRRLWRGQSVDLGACALEHDKV